MLACLEVWLTGGSSSSSSSGGPAHPQPVCTFLHLPSVSACLLPATCLQAEGAAEPVAALVHFGWAPAARAAHDMFGAVARFAQASQLVSGERIQEGLVERRRKGRQLGLLPCSRCDALQGGSLPGYHTAANLPAARCLQSNDICLSSCCPAADPPTLAPVTFFARFPPPLVLPCSGRL